MFSCQGAVTNPDPIVRCAAGEALGRIAQAVGSPVFTSSMTQRIFDQLKAARDAVSRTGYSVALGCIHRYVGGMASGHHLNSSVSILLALSKDNSSSLVQVNVRVYLYDLLYLCTFCLDIQCTCFIRSTLFCLRAVPSSFLFSRVSHPASSLFFGLETQDCS